MAIGIIVESLAILGVLAVIQYYIIGIVRLQGVQEGMTKEAQSWVDAINKVTVPNWQSLPIPPNTTPEQAQIAAKIYVEAFGVALDVIKEDIAMNRINAILDQMQELALKSGKLKDVK